MAMQTKINKDIFVVKHVRYTKQETTPTLNIQVVKSKLLRK